MLIIRPINDTFMLLVDQRDYSYKGKNFVDTYWLECDALGNIQDSNADGKIERKQVLFSIPEGETTLDVSTLSNNCLENCLIGN